MSYVVNEPLPFLPVLATFNPVIPNDSDPVINDHYPVILAIFHLIYDYDYFIVVFLFALQLPLLHSMQVASRLARRVPHLNSSLFSHLSHDLSSNQGI